MFKVSTGTWISFVRPLFVSRWQHLWDLEGKCISFRPHIANLCCCGDKVITEFILLEIHVHTGPPLSRRSVVNERGLYPTTPKSRRGTTPCERRQFVRHWVYLSCLASPYTSEAPAKNWMGLRKDFPLKKKKRESFISLTCRVPNQDIAGLRKYREAKSNTYTYMRSHICTLRWRGAQN